MSEPLLEVFNKPFIVRKFHEYAVPPTSSHFDEGSEDKIRYVQGTNMFLIVNSV